MARWQRLPHPGREDCREVEAGPGTRGGARTTPLLAALLLASTWASNVSLQTSAASASVSPLTLELGPAWALLYLLVAAIGWARLHLRVHTPGQVVMGAALGTTVCAAVICFHR